MEIKDISKIKNLQPRTGFAVTATHDVSFGARELKTLEIFTKNKQITLNENDCLALMEEIRGTAWVVERFKSKTHYSPYQMISGSFDGLKQFKYMAMHDDEIK